MPCMIVICYSAAVLPQLSIKRRNAQLFCYEVTAPIEFDIQYFKVT